MTPRLRTLSILGAVLLAAVTAGMAQADCQIVRLPYSTLSTDGGQSFLPYRGRPVSDYFLSFGVSATGTPGLIFMHAADTFWASEDDGCTWSQFGPVTSGLFRIARGPGSTAYAWPLNGGSLAYRLEPAVKGTDPYAAYASSTPEFRLQGFAVDAGNASHVRAVGRLGQIYDSTDSGTTWQAIGVQASPGGTVVPYFGAFDPQNLDHVLYGQVLEGGFVTFDGGRTWTQSTGLSTGSANFFKGVISPVDGNMVFGMALDNEENQAGDPSGGRHIYVSDDGGLSFTPVLDQGTAGVALQNGPVMVADASSAGVLHFIFSVRPVFGGTTFYTYDHATGSLLVTSNGSIPQIRDMDYSIADPGRLIVGFEFVP